MMYVPKCAKVVFTILLVLAATDKSDGRKDSLSFLSDMVQSDIAIETLNKIYQRTKQLLRESNMMKTRYYPRSFKT